jgi:hypothetical protein
MATACRDRSTNWKPAVAGSGAGNPIVTQNRTGTGSISIWAGTKYNVQDKEWSNPGLWAGRTISTGLSVRSQAHRTVESLKTTKTCMILAVRGYLRVLKLKYRSLAATHCTPHNIFCGNNNDHSVPRTANCHCT